MSVSRATGPGVHTEARQNDRLVRLPCSPGKHVYRNRNSLLCNIGSCFFVLILFAWIQKIVYKIASIGLSKAGNIIDTGCMRTENGKSF